MVNPSLGMAVLRRLNPETAHDLAIWALKNELVPQVCGEGRGQRGAPARLLSLSLPRSRTIERPIEIHTHEQNKCGPPDPPSLRVSLWGLSFPSPVGVAAGFDKHAEAMKGLLGLGLGFVEVGSVTPEPQPGNPKPRMFRLSEDRAVINRYGFNSEGLEAARKRLQGYWEERLRGELKEEEVEGVVGVNVGKNKLTGKAEDDYVRGT